MPDDQTAATPRTAATTSGLIRPSPIGGSALVRDYLDGQPSALAFFAGSPFDLDVYRSKLEAVSRRFGPDERAAAVRSLRPSSEAARERLDRFLREGGAMVTTGQQAGFLTGPLYTIYKALSGVVLAQHLEEALGVPVLPVFWVASEDHDWAEVNHAYLLDPHNRARVVGLESDDPRPLPMSERLVEGDIEALLEEVTQIAAPNKTTAEWVERLLEPYRRPGVSVSSAFSGAMEAILAPFDVCIADASNPELKRTTAPVLRRALEEAERHERVLAERTQRLEEAGYRGQVAVMDRGTNVFYHGEGGRERLYRRGQDFGIRGHKPRLERDRLLEELAEHPSRFSPNVFLRPVVESSIYPTLSYVGGPGELAYFAQVGSLFEAFEIEPPVAMPRFSALIMEPKVERLMERLDLRVEDTRLPREQLVERFARRELPGTVTSALAEVRAALARDYERLLDEAAKLDQTLGGPVGGSRNRSLLEAAKVERKILRSLKRGDRLALDQLDRALDSVRPNGAAQDRVLNVLPFLARYGDHFLREIMGALRAHWPLPE